MQMIETVFYWAAVIIYALGFAFMTISRVFRKEKFLDRGFILSNIGFALHSAAITVRWIQTGAPPFVSFFESASAAAWFAVLAYIILGNKIESLKLSGIGVLGGVFLLMGWASTPSISGEALSPVLKSVWLFIHATFATSAIGCYLVAMGISIVWLRKLKEDKENGNSEELPDQRLIDEVAFRFIAIGFLFYTIMVISGAIWANQAWGRYWGWDAIETWSLLSWLVYALYIHLHFTFKKLRGRFTAWYSIIAVLIAAFSLWGVSYLYDTIHLYG